MFAWVAQMVNASRKVQAGRRSSGTGAGFEVGTGEVAEHPIETRGVVGSSPAPRAIYKKIEPFQFRMREPLGDRACPYAFRWVLNLGLVSFRVHQWYRSDDKRYFHDHPWHFVTLVLRGGYTDVSPEGKDALTRGSIRFRRATWRHYVDIPEHGALTFLITSAKVREWGFWVAGKFKRPLRYFGKYGHPPCNEQ